MVEYNLLFETSTAAATAAILSIVIELEVTDIESEIGGSRGLFECVSLSMWSYIVALIVSLHVMCVFKPRKNFLTASKTALQLQCLALMRCALSLFLSHTTTTNINYH
jgi:hypothetical protein